MVLPLQIRPGAHGMGFDTAGVGQQLRASFQGIAADEIQKGPEAYEIDVRMADMDKNSLQQLENFHLTRPAGIRVPMPAVVTWKMERDWARIARFNGMRAVTLRGDVDTRLANTRELMARFNNTWRPEFAGRYPDIQLTIAGSLEETTTSQKSMFRSMMIGFIGRESFVFVCLLEADNRRLTTFI